MPSKSATYNKERRDRLKSLGICYICGKNPTDPGYSRCPSCREAFKNLPSTKATRNAIRSIPGLSPKVLRPKKKKK